MVDGRSGDWIRSDFRYIRDAWEVVSIANGPSA